MRRERKIDGDEREDWQKKEVEEDRENAGVASG